MKPILFILSAVLIASVITYSSANQIIPYIAGMYFPESDHSQPKNKRIQATSTKYLSQHSIEKIYTPATQCIYPLIDPRSPVSSHYGARRAPCEGCSTQHLGTDFNPPRDPTPVYAIAEGSVVDLGYLPGGYGEFIKIRHKTSKGIVYSFYAHLERNSSQVARNQTVQLGDLLGIVGSTGRSTGTHLHFEIRTKGEARINSLKYLENNCSLRKNAVK